jgi:hypothetical protein
MLSTSGRRCTQLGWTQSEAAQMPTSQRLASFPALLLEEACGQCCAGKQPSSTRSEAGQQPVEGYRRWLHKHYRALLPVDAGPAAMADQATKFRLCVRLTPHSRDA